LPPDHATAANATTRRSAETSLRRAKCRDRPPSSASISSPHLAAGGRRQAKRLAHKRAPKIGTTFHDHPEPTDHNQQQQAAEQIAADVAVAVRIEGSAMCPLRPLHSPHFSARFRVTDLGGANRRALFAPPIFRQLAHSLPFVASVFSRPALLPAGADRPAPASSACGLIKWNPRTSSCPSGATRTAIRSPNTTEK